jgi:hypothetical protein
METLSPSLGAILAATRATARGSMSTCSLVSASHYPPRLWRCRGAVHVTLRNYDLCSRCASEVSMSASWASSSVRRRSSVLRFATNCGRKCCNSIDVGPKQFGLMSVAILVWLVACLACSVTRADPPLPRSVLVLDQSPPPPPMVDRNHRSDAVEHEQQSGPADFVLCRAP